MDSGTWKWICNLKPTANADMMRIIGNGHTTLLLYDRWGSNASSPPIQDMPGNTPPTDKHKWTVADIVRNGQWILHDQALMPIWDSIRLQKIPKSNSVVIRKWDYANSGSFNFKSAWDLVRDRDTRYQYAKI